MKKLLFGLLCVTWFLLGSFTIQLVKYSLNSRTHCIYQGVGGTIENKGKTIYFNEGDSICIQILGYGKSYIFLKTR